MHILRQKIIIALLILLVLLASLAGLIHWRMNYALTEVIQGELYRSAEISPKGLARLASRHNIKTVIDLRTHDSDKHSSRDIILEGEALASVGVSHINLSTGQTPEMETVSMFLEILDDPNRRPVLIHCHHGIGRTGLFVALYLIEYAGYTKEKAREHVAGYFTLRLGGRDGFRSDSNKGRFIMNYQPRSAKGAEVFHGREQFIEDYSLEQLTSLQ